MRLNNQLDELIEKARRDGWANRVCSAKQITHQTFWRRTYTIIAGR